MITNGALMHMLTTFYILQNNIGQSDHHIYCCQCSRKYSKFKVSKNKTSITVRDSDKITKQENLVLRMLYHNT